MLNHKGTIKIETPRLILRRWGKNDAVQAFKNWTTDSEVTKHLTWKSHANLKVTVDVVDSWVNHYDEKSYHWAIVLKENGEVIGDAAGHRSDEGEGAIAFGYALSREYWGKGIMTEAMSFLLDFWFNQVGYKVIEAIHHNANAGSRRVIEKLGMKYIKQVDDVHENNAGICVPSSIYLLTKEQYNSLKIRKAYCHDVFAVAKSYHALTEYLENSQNFCGWKTDIYPTSEVAQKGFDNNDLYVAVKGNTIAGSFMLNNNQDKEYVNGNWKIITDNPLVVHTMAVSPDFLRQGVAEALLSFADEMARKNNCKAIRLDTAETNLPAIKLYEKCGYTHAGSVDLGYNRGGINNWILFEKEI